MAKALRNEYHPDAISPPGETLQETLEKFGMAQTELAERIGRPLSTINAIIMGKAPISLETALQLERVLGIPARFWNSRELHYREYLAYQEEDERLAQQTEWMNEVPVKALIKLNWIQKCSTTIEQAREILNFYGVATPNAWKEIYYGPQAPYCPYGTIVKSKAFEGNPAAVAAWLRRGEIEARDIECQPYDKWRFRAMLTKLRALSAQNSNGSTEEIARLCAECGVAVVFVPEIPGTRLSGAARWLTLTKALLQISTRCSDEGNLWFALFHEAGHILLHGKRGFFVDVNVGEGTDEKEAEADEFACNLLIPPARFHHFVQSKSFTDAAIHRFAEEIGIAPDIVVGWLQRDGVIEGVLEIDSRPALREPKAET